LQSKVGVTFGKAKESGDVAQVKDYMFIDKKLIIWANSIEHIGQIK
jgi:hypothetical protein